MWIPFHKSRFVIAGSRFERIHPPSSTSGPPPSDYHAVRNQCTDPGWFLPHPKDRVENELCVSGLFFCDRIIESCILGKAGQIWKNLQTRVRHAALPGKRWQTAGCLGGPSFWMFPTGTTKTAPRNNYILLAKPDRTKALARALKLDTKAQARSAPEQKCWRQCLRGQSSLVRDLLNLLQLNSISVARARCAT